MAMHKRKEPWKRKVRGKIPAPPEHSSLLDSTDEEIEACKARAAEGARCWCAETCYCRKCPGTSECTLEEHQVESGCWACHKCSECKPCF